ncbi:MAG: MlaC/ttg2D family ABC transporter substrate-binding protein [Hyphomonas sp.]
MRVLKTVSIAVAIAAMMPLSAWADAKTEAYVEENANEVLKALNDPDLTADQRTEQFNTYMDEFADFNAISNFAIGKYSRRFTSEERAEYRVAFRAYALAVYQNELDAYRGEAVTVEGSVDRSDRDSIVNTIIKRQDGKDMNVRWRVFTRDGKYQVVDVALNIEGNLIWLGIEQRAQYLSILDRNNGSAAALIEVIKQETAKLNAS